MKPVLAALSILMLSMTAYAAKPECPGKSCEAPGKTKERPAKPEKAKGPPVKSLICHYEQVEVLDELGVPVIDLETGLPVTVEVSAILMVPERSAHFTKHLPAGLDVDLETGDEVADAIAMENCLDSLPVEDEEEEEEEEPVEVEEISLDPVDSLLSP